jgi:hypothetical protein
MPSGMPGGHLHFFFEKKKPKKRKVKISECPGGVASSFSACAAVPRRGGVCRLAGAQEGLRLPVPLARRVEMSRKEVNNEQAQWDREKKHKDALIRSVLVCLCLSRGCVFLFRRRGVTRLLAKK